MKKLTFTLLTVLALPAFAKVGDDSSYVELGGGAGITNYYSNAGNSGLLRLDGGFVLNQVVNFQVGLNNYFGTTINDKNLGTYNLNGWGYDLTVLPTWGIGTNNSVNLFLRAGIGQDFMNASVGNTNSFIDVEGLGIRYDISSHLGLTGQWMSRGLLLQPSSSNYNQNIFMANFGLFF